MKGAFWTLGAFLCISIHFAHANDSQFVPDGQDYPRFDPGFTNGGINEHTFNKVIDVVNKSFGPVVKSMGATLVFHRLWQDDQINAKANKGSEAPGQWIIKAYGGLARRSETSEDAFALVMCHELGHLIGGKPFKPNRHEKVSNEGQSDYWGAGTCFPVIAGMLKEDKHDFVTFPVSAKIYQQCQETYVSKKAQSICIRANKAGIRLSHLLAALADLQTMPSFDTPDQTEVELTYHGHPHAQCRLDTYYAGAMGNARPRCWYAPKDPSNEVSWLLAMSLTNF